RFIDSTAGDGVFAEETEGTAVEVALRCYADSPAVSEYVIRRCGGAAAVFEEGALARSTVRRQPGTGDRCPFQAGASRDANTQRSKASRFERVNESASGEILSIAQIVATVGQVGHSVEHACLVGKESLGNVTRELESDVAAGHPVIRESTVAQLSSR